MVNEEYKTENERKKEYLSRYTDNKKKVARIAEQIKILRNGKMFPGASIGAVISSGNINDLSGYIAKLESLTQKMMKEAYKAEEICEEIWKAIEIMDSEQEKQILTCRYIYGYSWDRITDKTGLSWAHVHRIHAKALKNFKILEKL